MPAGQSHGPFADHPRTSCDSSASRKCLVILCFASCRRPSVRPRVRSRRKTNNLKEFVSANERHPESGHAVSLGRNRDECLHFADPRRSAEIRGDCTVIPNPSHLGCLKPFLAASSHLNLNLNNLNSKAKRPRQLTIFRPTNM